MLNFYDFWDLLSSFQPKITPEMNKTKEAGIIKNINHKKAPPHNAIPPKNTKTVASITIHGKSNLLNLPNFKTQ